MTCDSTMGKCYMGQCMQYVEIIKYGIYMVHRIFCTCDIKYPKLCSTFLNYI